MEGGTQHRSGWHTGETAWVWWAWCSCEVTSVGLTVARTHLPLGPRWGFTVLPHPGQPHATVMPGVEQSVRSVMPGVEPRGRRPRERPVDVPGWPPGARAAQRALQAAGCGPVPCASAARFEGDPQTKHHCRPSIPLANALLGRATLPIVRGLLNFARRDRGVDPHQVT